MKVYKNNLKDKLIKLLGFIIFCVLLIRLYTSITYLFRDYSHNRYHITGIKEEPSDSIDVIYIGGSAAYVYWNPAQAYKDHGFTSYNLAVDTIQAESLLPLVKYAQEYQNPELYIIDARPFQYFDNTYSKRSKIGLLNIINGLDLGFDRYKLIHNYLSDRTITDVNEILNLNLDIIMHHVNYSALRENVPWALMDNSIYCENKGFEPMLTFDIMKEPGNIKNDERAALNENAECILLELLDYLKAQNLNAIFVTSPYIISAEEHSTFNTIGDIVSGYGYTYLNANDYYSEMNVDFTSDFYNRNHMNVLGSYKYTEFLGNYLVQNYNLPNHHGDEQYREWQKLADESKATYKSWEDELYTKIDYAEGALRSAESMKATDDFLYWSNLVCNDDRFTIVTAGDCPITNEELSFSYERTFDKMGLSDIYHSNNFINVGGKTEKDISIKEFTIKGEKKFIIEPVSCIIALSDEEYILTINGLICGHFPKNRTNLIVLDNYHKIIADAIYLEFNNGEIQLKRE